MTRGRYIGTRRIVVLLATVLMAALLGLVACAPQEASSSSASADASSSAAAQASSSSAAAAKVEVPNVVAIGKDKAEQSITAVGLKLGKVTQETSETVKEGVVISQKPAALEKVDAGASVDLVVSAGKPKPKEVKVPNIEGMAQSDAEAELKKVNLVPSVSTQETFDVESGIVIEQAMEAGSTVVEGTEVGILVAKTPTTVSVPNVVGMTKADAEYAITKARLNFGTKEEYSNDVAEGLVISQSVKAGSKVDVNSSVTATISRGAKPEPKPKPKPVTKVTVPNLRGMTWSDAKDELQDIGLKARYEGDKKGVVVAQDTAAGRELRLGSVVTVTLEAESEEVIVPDLVGESVQSAYDMLDELDLKLDTDKGGFHGVVKSQKPKAGTEVKEGSTVKVKVDTSDFE